MTRFRPCIDLHAGQVKQIVGGTLDSTTSSLQTNFISPDPPSHFARLYRDANLLGAHVIMLGPGNREPAKEALAAWPGGLQIGGGITEDNAREWIDSGADKVIITSHLFPEGKFSQARLDGVLAALGGDRAKLVIDLSCRRYNNNNDSNKGKSGTWYVAMNKWQTMTDMEVCEESIRRLEPYCSEFLIHAADNEGLQRGIDEKLVESVKRLSKGKVDLTIGSALDCFGGSGVTLAECVEWNKRQEEEEKVST
jgi:phosphoribosylformimino-5-aminoimidazole carboxamide ribotide isomerase